MEKKNILIVLNCMGVGGIAKSLKNFLIQFEKYKDEYSVDLFLLKNWGVHLDNLPKYVNIIESKKGLQLFGCSQRDSKQFGKMFYLKRFFVAVWTKLFSNYLPLKIFVKQNKIKKHYDVAMAFAHSMNSHDMGAGSMEFVLDGVEADKKFEVLHGDVIIEKLLNKSNIKKFKRFDKVFSVSKSCSELMVQNCPELKDNADFLYNTQDNNQILEKANAKNIFDENKFNIVSISRLENQKAHMRVMPIIKKLHDEGFSFCYNIIGDGVLRTEIENYIKNNDMKEYVKMYGNQNNPYPYFKSADLFMLMSYYEAAPMVYNEAKILNIPIFTTEIVSSHEMVDGFGIICENNEAGIYEGLKDILLHKEKIKIIKDSFKGYVYDNDKIIKKFLTCVNDK